MNHTMKAARGLEKAELVLKNANIVNVFTESIDVADIAIQDGIILGIGEYEGVQELDCSGQYIAPGFLDGHIHIESSMLNPAEFARAVICHGTTGVVTDPHEIANVAGLDGIAYMMHASKGLPIDVNFVLPSCVPATHLDESGSVLLAKDLYDLYKQDHVLGLAEVMNYIGTINGDTDLAQKIADAHAHHKVVDGHAPGLTGRDACAYVLAGVESDHECSTLSEALEKLRIGQWIMIREGTAAKNMEALMGLFSPPYHQRAILVTDDKHPHDLISDGHIDAILRKAVKLGADPCRAIKMATHNTATYFKMDKVGAIAPGYRADLVILTDLENMQVHSVIKNGRFVVKNFEPLPFSTPVLPTRLIETVSHSFHCAPVTVDDFQVHTDETTETASYFRVIQLIKDEILTKELTLAYVYGSPRISVEDDILKLAVIERHKGTGHIGLGYVNGFGLSHGAIASSVSHDSHNLIVVGTNDEDMVLAANCVSEMEGGWAIAKDGVILGSLALSIGGLMSTLDAITLSTKIASIKETARELGVVNGIDPFMTLAFISLPVIPEIRLTTNGLIDANTLEVLPLVAWVES